MVSHPDDLRHRGFDQSLCEDASIRGMYDRTCHSRLKILDQIEDGGDDFSWLYGGGRGYVGEDGGATALVTMKPRRFRYE